jgi:endonuclease G
VKFGKFDSFETFIDSYRAAERRKASEDLATMPQDLALEKIRSDKVRAVVEVKAKVAEDLGNEGGEASHQHFLINIDSAKQIAEAVEDDVNRVIEAQENVFLAIRYGDSMGLTAPVEGMTVGAAFDAQGEWIPKDKAYAHGGENMSVLHFTHHPLGFICSPLRCYS